MDTDRTTEHVQVVVIGAGQAGLSVGYCLAAQKVPFVILESNERVGDSWRQRWNSLRLFTPAKYSGIVGMRFPAPAWTFPTKDEMADFLEAYATRFTLPIRTSTKVDRLWRDGTRYVVDTSTTRFYAEHVVVAMSSYQTPRVPDYAKELDPRIVQLHSTEYTHPRQLEPGDVLIVGAANSGADIALDIASTHRTWLSGRHPGHVPFRIETMMARLILPFLFRVVFHRILTTKTPMGRKMRREMFKKGHSLIRVKPVDLTRAGVERTARVAGVKDGRPVLEDGRVMDVANVIWCTGYGNGLSFIDLPITGADGQPIQDRGIVPGEPGLYFVGQQFLYAASSTMIQGVERDARFVADTIGARVAAAAHTMPSIWPTPERRDPASHAVNS
jgi:putative flavoprotein involved in K+ transport